MRIRNKVFAATIVGAFAAAPADAQSNDQFWRETWFWGVQAGAMVFQAGGTTEAGMAIGGHWFITAGRSALNLAFDQLFFTSSQTSIGAQPVTFSRAQRVSATVYAMPSTTGLQVYLGGGFALEHVTNSSAPGTFPTPQQQTAFLEQVDAVATKAFAILGGGVQWRWAGKWVVFGQYQFQPSTNDFLIGSAQHVIQGGFRYGLTGSKEAVTGSR